MSHHTMLFYLFITSCKIDKISAMIFELKSCRIQCICLKKITPIHFVNEPYFRMSHMHTHAPWWREVVKPKNQNMRVTTTGPKSKVNFSIGHSIFTNLPDHSLTFHFHFQNISPLYTLVQKWQPFLLFLYIHVN